MAATKIPIELSSTPGIVDNSNATAITIDSSENVGIGTTSPSALLHIGKTLAGSDTSAINIQNVGIFTWGLGIDNAVSNSSLLVQSGGIGGTTRLAITSSGDVGIGTSSPSGYRLNVSKGATGNVAQITDGIGNTFIVRTDASTLYTGNANNYPLAFVTNDTERMRIDTSGNVGIGTSSPNGKLTISNSGAGGFELTPDTTSFGVANTNYIASYDRSASAYRDIVFDLGGAENQSVRFKAGGNVGIGTSSPTEKLDVNGGAVIKGLLNNAAGTGSALRMAHSSNVSEILSLEPGVAWRELRTNASHHTFYIAGGEKMRIDSGGRLQVGLTNAPISGYDSKVNLVTNGGTYYGIMIKNLAAATSNAISFLNSSDSETGRIEVTTSATTYNSASDYRLKENIQPLTNGLERVQQLNPVQFDWKGTGKTSEGFIAHEAQEIFPDAVSGEKDGEKMQGMDYGRITPLLVKAIQELSNKVDNQQTLIEELKTRIETLENI